MGNYAPRGALALYDPQPISDRPVGLGFPHRAGRFRTGGSLLSSPGCQSCRCMERFLIRGWGPVAPGWRWRYFRALANQRSAGGVGFSTPCGAVSTRGITVFVPELSELYMYGRISEPGAGTYPARVRRNRGVSPRGNSHRARLAPSLAEGGRGGRLGQWDWGSENAGMKVMCLLY